MRVLTSLVKNCMPYARNSKHAASFESLIADLSLKFINLPANEVDPEIEDAQRRVCQCLGLDMCSLWQWSAESPDFLR